MAFVSGFEYDVFVSYCRVDDLVTTREREGGWITRFQNDLRVRLAQRLGSMRAELWWDRREIDGGQIFDQTIERAASGSAAFVALCSPAYLESHYCKQELQYFAQKMAGEREGAAAGDRSRIIPVFLYNIPYAKWPSEFPKTAGFEFFQTEDRSKPGKPCAPDSDAFDARLSDLADSLVRLLQALQTRSDALTRPVVQIVPSDQRDRADIADGSGPVSQPENRSRIFLADVADSLRQERSRLAKHLCEAGMAVDADVPPPYEAIVHDEHVSAAIHSSLVSIHLFDGSVARPMQGDPAATYPQRQYELAMRSPTPRIVWVPPEETRPEAPDLRALPPPGGNPGRQKHGLSMLIHGLKTDLVARVLAALQDEGKRENERRAATMVLLDFHSKDFPYALQADEQCQASGLRTLAGPEADNPRANMKLYTERLRQSGTVVIAFGRVSEVWVRERIHAALQTIVKGECPTRQLVVYLAPPQKADFSIPPKLGNIGLSVIDHSRGFDRAPDLGAHIMQVFSGGRS